MSRMTRTYALLGSLYVTQYLGIGFFFVALPAIMRQNGAPLEQISLVYLLGLFWVFKFLWSPLVDRYGWGRLGRYRGWLIVMQSALVITLLVIGLLDIRTHFVLIFALAILVSLFSATQDIAADALAVRLLPPTERGVGNGVQLAGGLLGNMIGGGLVLIVYTAFGWGASMAVLAAGTALPLMQIIRFGEAHHSAASAERAQFRDLLRFVRRPGMGRWIVLLLLFTIGINLGYGLITPLLVDAGWSLDRIGVVTNVVGSLVGLLAALVAGALIKRLGRKPALVLFSLVLAVSLVGLVVPALGYVGDVAVACAVGGMMIGYSAAYTVLSTIMMDKTRAATAGTDYTLQYCITSFMGFLVGGMGLALAGSFGYAAVLVAGAVIALLVAIATLWLYVPDVVASEPLPAPDGTLMLAASDS